MPSIAQAAAHLFLDERRFRELVDAGTISKAARGAYDLDKVREEYVRNLRQVAAGRAPTGDLDPGQEKARKDKEYADHLAMRNAITRQEYASVDDITRALHGELGIIRNRILQMPMKLADRIAMKPRAAVFAAIEEEAIEALTELSGEAEIITKAARPK